MVRVAFLWEATADGRCERAGCKLTITGFCKKIGKCVASKGLTDAFFRCVATKGLTGEYFGCVAMIRLTGFSCESEKGEKFGRRRQSDVLSHDGNIAQG